MSWRNNIELLRLCNSPASIISPFPIFAISLFLISRREFNIHDLPILFAGIVISLFSNFGSNLWNHCNDIKEDLAQGKKTILTQDRSMQKTALFIAVMLYAFSILFVYYLSIELKKPIYLFFLIWAFATWWYSDNLILKKIIGFRLKEHYIGEFITYGVAWPTYTLSIWLVYSDLNAKGVLTSAAFFLLSISALLLKDLKDITGDRKAGLKTFGVTFSPSRLIRYSSYMMLLFYFILLNPLSLNLFGIGILVMIFPFVYFFKNTFAHMYKKNWVLELEDMKALKCIGKSIYASVIFIGLSAFH
ncbi:MAG: UbiA family prenyltransferase [Candidatus Methanoperedens sp.]|nr:UbiA family prenyltransferase [Candidatus Methanoperedens sp.]MCZ7371964.1 UbiA family prenyltransferase [Candidatus Methanoperedens sp.]